MSGVAVIRALLAANGALTAVVPAASIQSGVLPEKASLPAIRVTQVDSVPRLTVAMTEAKKLHTDRVQVSVFVRAQEATPKGDGYPGVRAILRLVLAACPNTHGTVNTVAVDSVLPDSEGPDLYDPVDMLYFGSRDFMVRWTG